MPKTRLDIEVLLPEVPDAEDACRQRLCDAIEARTGVDTAHMLESADGSPARLCVHFDPEALTLQDLRQIAERAAMKLQDRYGHLLVAGAPTARAVSRVPSVEQKGGNTETFRQAAKGSEVSYADER